MRSFKKHTDGPVPYVLIRSARRTVSIEVTAACEILVRAPQNLPHAVIREFLFQHERWIMEKLARQRRMAEQFPEPDEQEIEILKARAKAYLPERVAWYATKMGVSPAWIKITSARKRFGSCGPENGLCFAWRLMRYPDAAIDSVVVHELAHIVYKNHSKDFYRLIEQVLPDYQERIKLFEPTQER